MVLLALLGGCGGARPAPEPPGAAVFAQSCRSCHSLRGNESARKSGGDLAVAPLRRSEVLQFAREMPVRHPLSERQLQAVSDYVVAAEGRAHRGRLDAFLKG